MSSAARDEEDQRVQEILNSLNLDELNGSPLNSPSRPIVPCTKTETTFFPDVKIYDDEENQVTDQGYEIRTHIFRVLDWNCEDMNEEFILEIFCNANNNFLPDMFVFQNLKLKENITSLLENFNFNYIHNDTFKSHSIESVFFSHRVFSGFENITRENIFLKVPGSTDFNKTNARFVSLESIKTKYEKFSNFWKVYATKFMEHMIITKLKLEETKCRKILNEGEVHILLVSFQNISKARSNNVDISREEFFLLGICFLCDLAEFLEASLVIGCCANFNALDDVCASWYPKGFKIVSKGKDKERDFPIDFFAYYQPTKLKYEMQIIKMCRFGHRDRFVPIYRNPHPIQLCDVAIRTRILKPNIPE